MWFIKYVEVVYNFYQKNCFPSIETLCFLKEKKQPSEPSSRQKVCPQKLIALWKKG